ncbi:MAG: hypothetical protein ACM3XN_01075 [Chloroflexota bacterium]
MALIPASILKRLYVIGSLGNVPGGSRFTVKNTLARGTIGQVYGLTVDGQPVSPAQMTLNFPDRSLPATQITPQQPCVFPVNVPVDVVLAGVSLTPGQHQIGLSLRIIEFGDVNVEFGDAVV